MDATALQSTCENCVQNNFEVEEMKRHLENKEKQLEEMKGHLEDKEEKFDQFLHHTAEKVRKQFGNKDEEIYNLKITINTLLQRLQRTKDENDKTCSCEQNLRVTSLEQENEDLKAKIKVLELEQFNYLHFSTEQQFKPLEKVDLLEDRLVALEKRQAANDNHYRSRTTQRSRDASHKVKE